LPGFSGISTEVIMASCGFLLDTGVTGQYLYKRRYRSVP
jgi:hypothetical protein